ncbi:hypothetical protein HDU93_002883 [Gonapodya sp. JEL0774]|nr:hypothetical protein HDU93_002883 [Gonapodya sp. JEL0774]
MTPHPTSDPHAENLFLAVTRGRKSPSAAAGEIVRQGRIAFAIRGGGENFLWETWNSLISVVMRVPHGEQNKLVDLLRELKHTKESPIMTVWESQVTWLDLPLLGPAFRESWNRPNEELCELNAFVARLTSEDVLDMSLYGIWAMRDVLEDHPRNQILREVPSRAIYVLMKHGHLKSLRTIVLWLMFLVFFVGLVAGATGTPKNPLRTPTPKRNWTPRSRRQRLDNGKICTVSRFDALPASIQPKKRPRFFPVCDESSGSSLSETPFANSSDLEDPSRKWKVGTGISNQRRTRLAGRDGGSPFSISLDCRVNDSALCDKVQTGFLNAARRIAVAISITLEIKVSAKFVSYCESIDTSFCGSSILGQASPAALWSVDTEDGVYMLPQALLKNVYGDGPNYSDTDITALFNADFAWWFTGDQPITPEQEDFEGVVMHEFVHGMGFMTGWNQWFSNYVPGQTFLTPPYYTWANGSWAFWAPQYIYDKLMIETSTSTLISNYYDQITNYQGVSGSSIGAFLLRFQRASGGSFAAAQKVYQLATSGPDYVRIKPAMSSAVADALPIWSGRYYSGGTTFSHLDDGLENTPDFLMISFARAGSTLDSKVMAAGSYAYGAMGPHLLGDLLGYNEQLLDVLENWHQFSNFDNQLSDLVGQKEFFCFLDNYYQFPNTIDNSFQLEDFVGYNEPYLDFLQDYLVGPKKHFFDNVQDGHQFPNAFDNFFQVGDFVGYKESYLDFLQDCD